MRSLDIAKRRPPSYENVGFDAQLVEVIGEARLYMHVVLIETGDSDDSQLAAAPDAILLEKIGDEHAKAAVFYDPVDVDFACVWQRRKFFVC